MRSSEDVVRELYENLKQGEIGRVIEAFGDDSEIEFIGPGSIPFAGQFHGKEGMGEMLRKLDGSAELLEFVQEEFHTSGDFVTVIAREHGRSKETGREWKTPLVETFEVRNGKVRHMRCLYDTAAVERAFTGAD